jgi:hypothetical protein
MCIVERVGTPGAASYMDLVVSAIREHHCNRLIVSPLQVRNLLYFGIPGDFLLCDIDLADRVFCGACRSGRKIHVFYGCCDGARGRRHLSFPGYPCLEVLVSTIG